MFYLFVILVFFSTSICPEGFPYFSEYHSKTDIETKSVENFLNSHEIIVQKNDLIPEAISVLEYLHVYSPYARDLNRSEEFLRKIFQARNVIKDAYVITAMEIAYAVFPYEFMEDIDSISKKSTNKRILSLAYLYLHRNAKVPKSLLQKLNSQKSDSLIHSAIRFPFQEKESIPALEDLLYLKLERPEWVLYIFRVGERGELILRDPNGNFFQKEEKIHSFPVYARSVTNLPSFFPMGDTPSGIYRILGITNSSNPRIGPVPVIQLGLPFEITVSSFFPGFEAVWSRVVYSRFLPENWKDVTQMYQTYQAGMNGRTNIWIHGATLDPKKFFRDSENSLHTPTFGCISLPEKWEKGNLVESKQLDLVSIWLSEGKSISGYAIVIDLPLDIDIYENVLLKIKKPR